MTPNTGFTDHLNRGREEIFRNLTGLLCLKGTVFKIYCIGQSGLMVKGSFMPLASCKLVQTVELARTYPQNDPLFNRALPGLHDNNIPQKCTYKILRQELCQ